MTHLAAWLNFVQALAALVVPEVLAVKAVPVVKAVAQALADPVADEVVLVEVDQAVADSAAVVEDLVEAQVVAEVDLVAVDPVGVVVPEVRAEAHVVRAKGNAEALLAGHQDSAIVEIVDAMASMVVHPSRSVIRG